ncbi:MAG: L-threonylcarbamoyladenylate synthase [Candidatus Margulisbacteria bacterium]|nr:L-threonylcarbamoyladenylate synthase [Candidatus Margulisiibacteriota bacterium]
MNKINIAANRLKKGSVIAFPTETVFGIGALLTKPKAIHKIYRLKKRPRNKPLQVLVATLEEAQKLGKFNEKALKLAKKRWPGPLTLVVYKTRLAPKVICGGTNKVGIRIPNHRTTLKLLKLTGPIAATSANMAGEKPALTTSEVRRQLPTIDYILPGKVKLGKASKVINVTKGNKILRP